MKRALVVAFGSLGLALAGCGDSGTTNNNNGGGGGGGDVTTAHGDYNNFVVKRILLPNSKSDYSIDLNGDNYADNQLGNIIGALTANNLDAQSGVDKSLCEGGVVMLISLQSADATLKTDDQVGVTFYVGQKFPNGKVEENDGGTFPTDCSTATNGPDFGGMGMFTVDTVATPSGGYKFFGKLANGLFKSNNPVTTKNPVMITVKVNLVSGVDPLELILNGAEVRFTTNATGTKTLTGGQLHGSVKKADIDGKIIPTVATLLTQQIAKDPTGSTATQVKGIFDTGGCMDGSVAATANDGIITTCEVQNNSIIQNVLAPDVQIYDATGAYKPNSKNTTRDSLSVGIGFEAVAATFTRP